MLSGLERQKDGKAVTITVKNALNMDNLEWKLEDKSEVVPKLNFTATYEEGCAEYSSMECRFLLYKKSGCGFNIYTPFILGGNHDYKEFHAR